MVLTFHLPSNLFAGRGKAGAANKLEGKWKGSLCLVAPPQAAVVFVGGPLLETIVLLGKKGRRVGTAHPFSREDFPVDFCVCKG